MTIAGLRLVVDRYHKAFVVVALCMLIASSAIISQLVTALPLKTHRSLERPMLAMEIPRSDREMYTLAPRASLPIWRSILSWDFLFIAGYVLLFIALWLPDPAASADESRRRTEIRRSVIYSAIATGFADISENVATLVSLSNIERYVKLAGSRAFTILPIVGTIKWLFFFMVCRALALQYRDLSARWYWIGAGLRALTTAGICATFLAFAGLPGRPVIAFVSTLSSVILLAAAVTRLLPERAAPEALSAPDSATAVT